MTAENDSIRASLALFPHNIDVDKGTVSLIRLTEGDYRELSFLDDRILPGRPVESVRWPDLTTSASTLSEGANFIFHVGHVGSTLLSRLLGSHPDVLPVREPAALRTLALARIQNRPVMSAVQFEEHLSVFLKLYARTFAPDQLAVVKATSFVSELAAEILDRPSAPKAIFLFVSAETYLATILAGPNSRTEARALAASRMVRLQRRIEQPIREPQTEGEAIAMNWVCEMAALRAADRPGRVLWIDFDAFLSDPQRWLTASFAHFGIAASDKAVADIIAGPEMRHYSKAPEYDYGPQLRADLLRQARAQSGHEIRRGLAWLDRLGAIARG